MILLQEEQSAVFDPVSVFTGNPPWYERAFALYLAFMLLVLVARSAQLAWQLTSLSRLQDEGAEAATRFRALWVATHARADSLRRFAVLTFLLTFAVASVTAAQIVAGVGAVKQLDIGAITRDASNLLYAGAAGLVLCAALYTAGFFFQARLVRRELEFARATSETEEDAAHAAAS